MVQYCEEGPPMSLSHHPDDTGAPISPQELVNRLRELDG